MNAGKFVAALAIVVLGACNSRDQVPLDASLSGDLALAASSQPYQPQQYVSPMEQGYAPAYAQPVVYRQPVATAPRQRTTTRAPAPAAPRGSGEIVRRNTRRDAVIGATAGAVIGATTSRDKTKGAIIGAAVGGVLGGIVGHTVDVERQ